MKIILASSSRYRKSLLQRLGLDFEIAHPEVDETPLKNELSETLVLRLARMKAENVGKYHTEALIIGSDQAASVDNRFLTKPESRSKAIEQLTIMRGKTISFVTGLCVLNTLSMEKQSASIPFNVSFRDFSEDEIERYIDTEKPYDCAGSFKSEQLGITLISHMSGDDPTALMGLPLIKLSEMLRNQGIQLP